MTKKKGNEGVEAETEAKAKGLVPIETVMKHPAVREMATRMETMQRTMENLPRLIGEAVQAAMANRPPAGASGPGVPTIEVKEVEIRKQHLSVDGQAFHVKAELPKTVGLEFTSGKVFEVQLARVVRISTEGVTLKPHIHLHGLDTKEGVWSLESGQRTDGLAGWKIADRDRAYLVKCAGELEG